MDTTLILGIGMSITSVSLILLSKSFRDNLRRGYYQTMYLIDNLSQKPVTDFSKKISKEWSNKFSFLKISENDRDILIGNVGAVKEMIAQMMQVKLDNKAIYPIVVRAVFSRQNNLVRELLPEITSLDLLVWMDLSYLIVQLGYAEIFETLIDFFKQNPNIFDQRLKNISIFYNNLMVIAAALGYTHIMQILIKKLGKKLPKNQEYLPLSPEELKKSIPWDMDILSGMEFNEFTAYPNTILSTPMHTAALCGQVASIELLHKAGFDINLQSQFGAATPLMFAVYGRQEAVVKKLATLQGIDFNIRDNQNHHALNQVFSVIAAIRKVTYDNEEIVMLLLNKCPPLSEDDLRLALGVSQSLKVRNILLQRVTNDRIVFHGVCHAILSAANINTAASLLNHLKTKFDKGLDLTSQALYHDRLTGPFILAATSGYDSLIEIFMAMKADINATGSDGRNALVFAIENRQKLFIEKLLNFNVNVNLASPDLENLNEDTEKKKLSKGTTALMVASQTGYYPFLEMLRQRKISVNVDSRRSDGKTALMLAASVEFDNSAIISQLLTDFKADINLRCHQHETALMVAMQNRQSSNIYYLLLAEIQNNILDPKSAKASLPSSKILAEFLSRQILAFNDNEELIVSIDNKKRNTTFGNIPLEIKQITLAKEAIQNLVRHIKNNPNIKNDSELAKLIFEESPEKTKFEYEQLEKMIFDMPANFTERLDIPYMESLFKRIEDTKHEINKDLESLASYLNNPGYKTNVERRQKSKQTELTNLQTQLKNIACPDPEIIRKMPEDFNKLYDENSLKILDEFRAGNGKVKEAILKKEALLALFQTCQEFQTRFINTYRALLELKSKIKEALIKHNPGIKSLQADHLKQEKERYQDELKAAVEKTKRALDELPEKETTKKETDLAKKRAAKKAAWLKVKEQRRLEVEARDLKLKFERQKQKEELQKKVKDALATVISAKSTKKVPIKVDNKEYDEELNFLALFESRKKATESFFQKKPTSTNLSDLIAIDHMIGKNEELDRLKTIIQSIQEPSTKKDQKVGMEDLIIVRYALLGTMARLMEHIMNIKETNGFPSHLAKQCRDAIFHRQKELYNIESKEFQKNLQTNTNIIDMVLKIITFIQSSKTNTLSTAAASASMASAAASKTQSHPHAPKDIKELIDSDLFTNILEDTTFNNPNPAECLSEIQAAKTKLIKLIQYLSSSGFYVKHYEVMNAAFGFIYGKLGTFAAALKQQNYKLFSQHTAEYEQYIQLGNDFRHGKTFDLEQLANSDFHGLNALNKAKAAVK